MTPREHAAYINALVKTRPVSGIEARVEAFTKEMRYAQQRCGIEANIETLVQEIRHARQTIETR